MPGTLTVRSLACFLAAAATSSALAEIDYHVSVLPDQQQIQVEMDIPAKEGKVAVQMPSWMPGAYVYGNFYEHVTDVKAKDAGGSPLVVEHPEKNTWTVDFPWEGTLDISYAIPLNGLRRFGGGADPSFVQIAGPATYMYVVGRKGERCKIDFQVPKDWPVMLSLDPVRNQPNTFSAPSYDVLADAPVSTGKITVLQYEQHGKPHYIVLDGKYQNDVDKQKLMQDCRFVSAAETDFFGSVPYHRYVWHFIVYPGADGGGGLEHLGSTQISLAKGLGPLTQSVLSHEFFHLWNVKRIRPKVLGPFDYTTLPRTGALWWLEGVTDYYAWLLPYRYGEWERDQFFKGIVRNYDSVENNPAHLTVSPYEASLRVADANNGQGNSNGYQISYYNLGWLCGMCLDIEIRSRTGGRKSLDDVIRALYNECKDNKPGFEEGEIRNLLVRIGGPTLGPLYDQIVMKAGELPVPQELEKVGLKVDQHEEPYVNVGFTMVVRPDGKGGIRGISGPAESKLQPGDTITTIEGEAVTADNNAALSAKYLTGAKAGNPVHLTVQRGDQTVQVEITPVAATRTIRTIVEDPSASPAAIQLRNGWLVRKTASEG